MSLPAPTLDRRSLCRGAASAALAWRAAALWPSRSPLRPPAGVPENLPARSAPPRGWLYAPPGQAGLCAGLSVALNAGLDEDRWGNLAGWRKTLPPLPAARQLRAGELLVVPAESCPSAAGWDWIHARLAAGARVLLEAAGPSAAARAARLPAWLRGAAGEVRELDLFAGHLYSASPYARLLHLRPGEIPAAPPAEPFSAGESLYLRCDRRVIVLAARAGGARWLAAGGGQAACLGVFLRLGRGYLAYLGLRLGAALGRGDAAAQRFLAGFAACGG